MAVLDWFMDRAFEVREPCTVAFCWQTVYSAARPVPPVVCWGVERTRSLGRLTLSLILIVPQEGPTEDSLVPSETNNWGCYGIWDVSELHKRENVVACSKLFLAFSSIAFFSLLTRTRLLQLILQLSPAVMSSPHCWGRAGRRRQCPVQWTAWHAPVDITLPVIVH